LVKCCCFNSSAGVCRCSFTWSTHTNIHPSRVLCALHCGQNQRKKTEGGRGSSSRTHARVVAGRRACICLQIRASSCRISLVSIYSFMIQLSRLYPSHWSFMGIRALTMQDSIIEFKTINYILFMVFCWCGSIFIEERGRKNKTPSLRPKSY